MFVKAENWTKRRRWIFLYFFTFSIVIYMHRSNLYIFTNISLCMLKYALYRILECLVFSCFCWRTDNGGTLLTFFSKMPEIYAHTHISNVLFHSRDIWPSLFVHENAQQSSWRFSHNRERNEKRESDIERKQQKPN